MDEKQFEQRMQTLKHSYESIPTKSSREKIMSEVMKTEKPIKRRGFFQLPYIASIIGVLMIGSIIGFQILQTNQPNGNPQQPIEQPKNQPVTTEEVETSINETRGYYERKVDELKEKLDHEDVEQFKFVKEAKQAVEKFEQRKEYASKAELATYMERVKEIISLRVSMPYEELALLKDMREKEEAIADQYILNYIEKLEILHQGYLEKWFALLNKNQPNMIVDYVEKLNSGNIQEGTDEYLHFIDLLKNNGYIFIELEGMIEFKIDYGKISKEFSGNVSDQLKMYLEIQEENRIKADGGLTISRDELENRLLELEVVILKSPAFEKVEELKTVYVDWINIYLTGIVNQQITNSKGIVKQEIFSELESFIEDHPNSETTKIVESFLNRLKDNDLKLPYEQRKEEQEYIRSTLPQELLPGT